MQSVPFITWGLGSNPAHGEVYSIQHYAIQFVNDLRQVGEFPPCTNKTDWHDIAQISGVKYHNSNPLISLKIEGGHDL
jgi:hypothetical protein